MIGKKIAIVYDWLDKWGGVERVLLTLHKMFPEADWYTSYYDKMTAGWAADLYSKTSFIQHFPDFIKKSRVLSLPFYPYAFESFNFSSYDKVLSITSSFAKGIITRPETEHICYLLTPTRYLWGMTDEYVHNSLVMPFIHKLREWDFVAAQRPDKIVSISHAVADRCKKYYGRESAVIYPAFDRDYWQKIRVSQSGVIRVIDGRQGTQTSGKYFLVVSRLEPYKKVDLVVNAFKELPDSQLVVVGEGSRDEDLQKMAGKNVQFIGKVSDEELAGLYSQAEALIMPQEEDFGYVALEAQSFGCPVIAFGRGGALETVKDGETGLFFKEQTVKSLLNILAKYHTMSYKLRAQLADTEKNNQQRFSRAHFTQEFAKLI